MLEVGIKVHLEPILVVERRKGSREYGQSIDSGLHRRRLYFSLVIMIVESEDIYHLGKFSVSFSSFSLKKFATTIISNLSQNLPYVLFYFTLIYSPHLLIFCNSSLSIYLRIIFCIRSSAPLSIFTNFLTCI